MTDLRPRPDSWPVTEMHVPGFDIVAGVHPAASVLTRHTHGSPTICAVQSGRFTEYYAGKAVDCDAGIVKVTPAGEPHWNRFAGVDTYGVRIDVDMSRFDTRQSIARLLDERLFFPAGAFTGLTDALIAEIARPDAVAGVAAEGLLLEFLARMARLSNAQSTPRQRWLTHADALVRDMFRSSLTVADVAETVGVHPATLARAYRREFGCTIARRIRQLRLEYAARELSTTAMPLSEIALAAGFYDQSHFSNAFRRQFGASPGQYRRECGGASNGVTPRGPRPA